MSEWISVKDRLPPEDQCVLVWVDGGIEFATQHNSFFVDEFHDLLDVTHWQPLPAPPSA
ncbi:DUF551 domain-containing protein [Pseudomonas sp. PI1]|jgi:hypothetical protein|uniref:DUF551 domain-containing protein n=1 Tax=Pseudomonas TaxID=286 RepID=UPI0009E23378|nr:DUF551 domain-containing protein [Pseudomonas sp. PI1]HBP5538859.1 DUF551 domain-containing protein [Pseudomonas aeruginosa]